MKLPTRAIAVLIWVIAIAVTASSSYASLRLAHSIPEPMRDTLVFTLTRADNSLTYLWQAFGLGAIIWVLGEIRDR
jgi:hypothetical protein